jgi:hypothetical protein
MRRSHGNLACVAERGREAGVRKAKLYTTTWRFISTLRQQHFVDLLSSDQALFDKQFIEQVQKTRERLGSLSLKLIAFQFTSGCVSRICAHSN